MQFIQFQSQDPNSLTTPSDGSFNVFVDQTDNTLKIKNTAGEIYGGASYAEITYSGLVNTINASGLTAGSFYLITDFRTCYDQPDFNSNKNEIIGGNYKQAEIEPILVFATSVSTISVDAYQPKYPNDKIKYDWTFNVTERTNGVAYGRITERIDAYNNRTDYDHRTILFKRYDYIEIPFSQPQTGTLNVTPTSATQMTLNGTNTQFTNLSTGQYVAFDFDNYRAYEIVAISGDTEMYVTGLTNTSLNGVKYYVCNVQSDTSYYQNNITTAYTEYYTFDYNDFNVNNYVGDYANSYYYDENSFILANNVFKGFAFRNNTFGDMCYNNTFDDDCENNIIGNYFYNNITDDDFDGNTIGNWFRDNKITSNFQYNRIGENFQNNYLVQNSFYRNNIMNYFTDNIIDGGDFQNNEIGSQFSNNTLLNGQFYKNDIGNGFNNNKFYSEVFGNLIGNGFNGNNIYCYFYDNRIAEYFEDNTLGDPLNYGSVNFRANNIGNSFYNNTCLGYFSYNTIGSDFYSNTIGDGFGFGYSTSQGNVIGNYFYNNTIGEYFYNNTIADGFYNNQVYDYFQMNNIKSTPLNGIDFTQNFTNITAFTYTTNGSTATEGTYNALTGLTNGTGVNALFNVVVTGSVVSDVTLNVGGKYYAVNDTITIYGVDYGGVSGQISSYSSNGVGKNGATGVYQSLPVTGGHGTNADFDVVVTDGLVSSVMIYGVGLGYRVGDQLLILGNLFGGVDGVDDITVTVDSTVLADEITITVTGVSPVPTVYEQFNCDIFKNAGNVDRLSFYDASDILTIKNIND